MVSFLCVVSLLSTLASLTKTPEHELYQDNRQHDPFSLMNSNPLFSMHHKIVLKLKKWAPRGFGDLGRRAIYFQGAGEHC